MEAVCAGLMAPIVTGHRRGGEGDEVDSATMAGSAAA
jgi:hypothetical protein